MEEFDKKCLLYLLIGLGIAFILASILLIYKVDCKESSVISFIFAYFFLIAFFFQPFLVTLDYALFIFETSFQRERNFGDIDNMLRLIYRIIGRIGTGFSLVVLPVYTHFYFSGYFTFGGRLKNAIKRYFTEDCILYYIFGIIIVVALIVGFVLIERGNEDFVLSSKDLAYNCLIIPSIIKCLLYLGSYFPILWSELKLICPCMRTKAYVQILNGVVKTYLNEDIKKLEQAYINLGNALNKSFSTENQRKEIKKIMKKVRDKKSDKNDKDFSLIVLNDGDNSGVITKETFIQIVCDSITEINETLLTFPRKLFVKNNINNKLEKEHGRIYYLYPILLLGIGIFILFIEIFGNALEYSEIRDNYGRIDDIYCIILLIFLIFYYMAIYFCVLKRNSITKQMLYGKRESDTLCLLNFATEISGLITPASFIVIYSNLFGIYQYENREKKFYSQNNMIFTQINKYIIIENIKPLFNLDISFKDSFWIYSYFKSFIILTFLIGSFFFHSFTLKGCCCCCKNKKYQYIFNDKNEKFCKTCRKETYEQKGEKDPLIELAEKIKNDN